MQAGWYGHIVKWVRLVRLVSLLKVTIFRSQVAIDRRNYYKHKQKHYGRARPTIKYPTLLRLIQLFIHSACDYTRKNKLNKMNALTRKGVQKFN